MKVFLDTNVLIDFLLERMPFYPAAATIISYAFEKEFNVAVSAQSLVTANFICIDRCKMPDDVYRRKMDFLREFIDVVSVSRSEIYQSYDARWKDFEDGVQYYCARNNGADVIVSRNVKDFEASTIPVSSPNSFVESLPKGSQRQDS